MNPEKIVCVGLNYARHARETNNALNCHQGTVRVSAVPATNFD
jgi:2-keto-4-pentenoate hydratase/2-oxohepta-3-ene-1,7-dioic acid hydratase in catechol pathway